MGFIKAFIGHSFDEKDQDVLNCFFKFFDSLKELIGFEWDHAEKAELKALSRKVREKIEGKNLFIGIFTKKGLKVYQEKLKKKWGRFYGTKNAFQAGTSEWIIQESGYGLAKCKNVLFLIEDGVHISAGLQGDTEYVSFSRENPEACFPKLMEMIGSVLPTKTTEETYEQKSIKPKDTSKDISEPGSQDEQQIPLKTKRDIWFEDFKSLYELIVEKKDFDKAKDRLDVIIERHKDNDKLNHIYWKSMFYRLKCTSGDSDGFRELEKLSQVYPEDPLPLEYLGSSFNNYNNFAEAAKNYLKASERQKEKIDKIRLIGKASEAYARDGNFPQAYNLIYRQFENDELTSDHHRLLFKSLANIAKLEENDTLFTCFAEKVLKFEPTDSDMRFSLAYRYGETGNPSFALHHYNVLCDIRPNGTNWNNIGVEYEHLDIKNKSILAYKKASDEFDETLAMANLAYRYIEQGFLDDAKKILDSARNKPNYHKNIDSHISRLNQIIESEEDQEKKILKAIEGEKKFKVEFAKAFAIPGKVHINGKWKSKHDDIQLLVEGNKLKGVLDIIPKSLPEKPAPTGGILGLASMEYSYQKKSIRIDGEINNRGIIYRLNIYVEPRNALALGGLGKSSIYEGLMVVAEDSRTINVMEKNEKNELFFYEMIRSEKDQIKMLDLQ